jgi:hypothetical protein
MDEQVDHLKKFLESFIKDLVNSKDEFLKVPKVIAQLV